MKNELQFRDSKNIKCKLVLTGTTDKIVCVCGQESTINFHLSKFAKTKIVIDFVSKHQNCKKGVL